MIDAGSAQVPFGRPWSWLKPNFAVVGFLWATTRNITTRAPALNGSCPQDQHLDTV